MFPAAQCFAVQLSWPGSDASLHRHADATARADLRTGLHGGRVQLQ